MNLELISLVLKTLFCTHHNLIEPNGSYLDLVSFTTLKEEFMLAIMVLYAI